MAQSLSIIDIGSIVFGSVDVQINYLQQKNLLASTMLCRCGTPMTLGRKSDISDSCIFRCRSCKGTKSLRSGSFFEKSRLTLQQWLVLLYWWVRQYPVTDAAEEAKVGRDTAIDAYQWFREICSTKLLNNPIQLGGPGRIVQIDESLFRHKPKGHRGRPPQSPIWVFGMVDTSFEPALGYMEIVPCRDAMTLLPIIQRHVQTGTEVRSDEWAAYRRVATLPNVNSHGVVNHSLNFVSPSGVHTQNIESYWGKVKTKIKRMKGCHEHQLSSYLDEHMYRERYGRTARECFDSIINDIATQYPV